MITSVHYANLCRLFWLRNIAIVSQVAALLFAAYYLALDLPFYKMSSIILLLCLINVGTLYYLKRKPHPLISHQQIFFHLLVDMFALAYLLYLSGGATNPFAILFLLPITIAATVLPSRYIWILTTISILSYSLLMHYYLPLAMTMSHHHHMSGEQTTIFNIHIVGMWLGFVLSAIVIAYFVVDMGNTLRQYREQTLRDERLVALGTLAASTAHELGTPLNTMMLLVEELDDITDDKQLIGLLEKQIARCQTALSTLSASAGSVRLDGGKSMPVQHYLDEVLTGWQQHRPNVNLVSKTVGASPGPLIIAEQTLTQALVNILDNAADVSPKQIEWCADWSRGEYLMISCHDQGPGIATETIQMIGKVPYSEQSNGLGLGLFLSHAIIERLGGAVQLYNHAQGGLVTQLTSSSP